MITKEIALSHKGTFYHKYKKNSDGTPLRCRVMGKCVTWVRDKEDFKLPVKHGMYNSFYITPTNANEWQVEEPTDGS